MSKAVHAEVVSKLEAIDRDLEVLEKRYRRQVLKLRQEVKFGIAQSQAQADSVKALFTGYALAARSNKVGSKTVETIKKVVKEAQEVKKREVKASGAPKPPRVQRVFKRPRSWTDIKKAIQQRSDR